jgi:hypothetical protein
MLASPKHEGKVPTFEQGKTPLEYDELLLKLDLDYFM